MRYESAKPAPIQPFAHTTLVIVNRREIAVRGLLVEEQRQRLATALDAAVELGIGLREGAGFQIRPPEIEVADPGVEKSIGLRQHFDRLTRVSIFQRGLAVDDLGVGLRLGLELGGEAGAASRAHRRRAASTNTRAARNRIFTALLFASAFSAARDGRALLLPQDV